MQRIILYTSAFEPWPLIQEVEQKFIDHGLIEQSAIGATANFVGRMRDFNEGDSVIGMELNHYPGMTEKQLETIIKLACESHQIAQAFIAHRVGTIKPGDAIVLVATWSEHRKAAFDACRDIMETLKHQAPFWKKELTAQGERWIKENTAG